MHKVIPYQEMNIITDPINAIMKKILLSLLFFPVLAISQSTDQNYIRKTIFRAPGAGNPQSNITYFDGLGRPVQQILEKQSATGKDILTPIEYDFMGRQSKEYLSFPSTQNTGNYNPNAVSDVMNYHRKNPAQEGFTLIEGTDYPYSEKFFEASPLNRVLKQAAPGDDWHGSATTDLDHTIKCIYDTNQEGEVNMYVTIANWDASQGLFINTLSLQQSYPIGSLYKTVIKDENWTSGTEHTTEEFKNKEDQVILKRLYDSGEKVDTYYIYDVYGNLVFVLPPLANGQVTPGVLEGLCYQYRYDSRNRLVEKKLPGKIWEYTIYDKFDRVVATGPKYSPFDYSKGWMITKYDVLNRVVLTGWLPAVFNSNSRPALQNIYDQQVGTINEVKSTGLTTMNGVSFRYTNLAYPTAGYHVFSVNYYDDYNFPGAPSSFSATSTAAVYYNNSNRKPKGLPTGTWNRVFQQINNFSGSSSYLLYDNKSRVVQHYKTNYLGGYTQTETQYDFIGKTLVNIVSHKRIATSPEIKTIETYEYTAQDRLFLHKHKINALAEETLSVNYYDELGQLTRKSVGGSIENPLQNMDYSYTVRGWLKGINRPSFAMPTLPQDLFVYTMNYNRVNNDLSGVVSPLYNGNIAEVTWLSNSDNVGRTYGYRYDGLNRLKDGYYQKNGELTNSYNENVTYDKNGNILTLKRNGDLDSGSDVIQIDDLNYTYTPDTNMYSRIKDHSNHPAGFIPGVPFGGIEDQDEYFYDEYGNMQAEDNHGIQFDFNHLNLPRTSYVYGDNIKYLYDASGQKLQKKITEGSTVTTIDYLDGFQYKNGVLLFFPTSEGYVDHTGENYNYVYNYTDHLGNVRMSYTKDPATGNTKILEENHYYPFGMKHAKYNADQFQYVPVAGNPGYNVGIDPLSTGVIPDFNYKYNGKEYQQELSLNLYDYSARQYDATIGRWLSIDKHADSYFSASGYSAFANNPVSFVDPTGEDILFWQWVEDKNLATKGKWVQVAFGKLNSKVQKGILNFLETKSGQDFFAKFAKDGDKIGKFRFKGNGYLSKHIFSVVETDRKRSEYEGAIDYTATQDYVNFQMIINKDMDNPEYNIPETIGHEIFLHLDQNLKDYVQAWKKEGYRGVDKIDDIRNKNNPGGAYDHISTTTDRAGKAKKYYEFISQLKSVLNPEEVQKLVDSETDKNFKVGTRVLKKYSKK